MSLAPAGRLRPHSLRDRLVDRLFRGATGAAAFGVVSLVVGIAVLLGQGALPSIRHFGVGFLFGTAWNPVTGRFAAWPFILGTLVTSGIALLIGVPVSVGIAIFLSEEAPGWIQTPLAALVELLAAVPSVVYGLWGFFVLAPTMRDQIQPALHSSIGQVPVIGLAFSGQSTGSDLLTAGVILAIMIIPTVSAIARESLAAVPRSQREAALALGATRWETTRHAVLPFASSAIIGAAILGLGRALGETMAVTMTIGNQDQLPTSLFSGGGTITSLLANEFTSAGSANAFEPPALFEVALILLAITLSVNVVARILVRRMFRGGEGSA